MGPVNNTDQLVRMLDSLATIEEVERKPRKRELVLIAICLLLVGAYFGMFDSEYEAAKMAEERKQDLRPATSFPQALKPDCDATMVVSAGLQTFEDICYVGRGQ